jgi:hypothetical protein
VRAFAWLPRFKDHLCMKVSNKNSEFRVTGKTELKFGNLKVDELKTAERNVVRYVQHTSHTLRSSPRCKKEYPKWVTDISSEIC